MGCTSNYGRIPSRELVPKKEEKMAAQVEHAEFDNSLRLYTYRHVVASGKAPTVAQAASEMGGSEAQVRAGSR